MKNILSVCAGLFIAFTAFSQASVTSAYNAKQSGDYVKAAEYIEKAMSNEKAVLKEKTWRYRGDIYAAIAKDSVLYAQYPNAIDIAMVSFKKANELDKRDSYKSDNDTQMSLLQIAVGNSGLNAFNNGNYTSAANYFIQGTKVSEYFNVVDTAAIFNTALSYERANMPKEAVEYYLKAGELDYGVDENAQAGNYSMAIRLLKESGEEERALEVLKMARNKYPSDQGLIIEELNYYLKDGDFEAAEKNLLAAVEKDPENANMRYAMGVVYDNLSKFEQAEAAYKKAIELKPDYFDANYNLGALYYNEAVAKNKAANDIPMSQQKKYDAAMKEVKATFVMALPYLESALKAQPEDLGTLQSLKEIYYREGNQAKVNELDKKIKEVQG